MDYWMELCFRMRLKEENLKIETKEYDIIAYSKPNGKCCLLYNKEKVDKLLD